MEREFTQQIVAIVVGVLALLTYAVLRSNGLLRRAYSKEHR